MSFNGHAILAMRFCKRGTKLGKQDSKIYVKNSLSIGCYLSLLKQLAIIVQHQAEGIALLQIFSNLKSEGTVVSSNIVGTL